MAGINRQKSFGGEVKKSLFVAIWFMFLTFPIMVIRVNTIEKVIEWRWLNMVGIGVGIFFLSFLWRYMLERKEAGRKRVEAGEEQALPLIQRITDNPRIRNTAIIIIAALTILYPVIFSTYQVNIMITALIYVMLGLGLNIVVGVAGLLDLGYVAFYLVGAYAYALLNYHYGLGFWVVLPIGGLLSMICGVLLGFPVLRLRGDYLAIVTLGFGEIIRLIMENWNAFSFGPSGISNIPRPGLLGLDKLLNWMGYEVDLDVHIKFLFFLMILLVVFTIFMVNRLQNSRIGRAWLALREDEIACQAMGIDKHKTKLTAFALGATWAGMAGVIFAAKTTFVNPASFTFMESALILSIVVLGGMGSIVGVIIGALIISLVPEYFRAFADYRMLLFGAALVLMMVFRPGGMIQNVQRHFKFDLPGGANNQGGVNHG